MLKNALSFEESSPPPAGKLVTVSVAGASELGRLDSVLPRMLPESLPGADAMLEDMNSETGWIYTKVVGCWQP